MPAYKNQHFLPAAYLREFSADQTQITRNSKIWRCDGKRNGLVSAANECRADFFYSKDQANAAETMFQPSEGLFAECARRIRHGKEPTKRQFFGLILIIFDLHLRNAAYENQTKKDNLHAYSLRVHGFKELLLGRQDDELTDDEVWGRLEKCWRIRILLSLPGNEFVTSDNPSILFASQEATPNLELALLPVTPTHVAVAYDCRQLEVTGERTSPQDEKLLNELQLSNAGQCVYSSGALRVEQRQFVAERLNHKSRVRGKTDETTWESSMWRLAPDVSFSFMRRRGGRDRMGCLPA